MDDPYASPRTAEPAAVPDPESPEVIRNKHLKHEASLRSIGTLYILGGGLGTVINVMSLSMLLGSDGGTGFFPPSWRLMLNLIVGPATFFVGFGLRRLKPWTRIPAIILSGIGLIGTTLSVLIHAYALYLVVSKKGRVVLSQDYAEVIRATPHIRYRTPKWVFALLILIVLLILFALFSDLST